MILQMKQKSMHRQCIYFKYISITGHFHKKKKKKPEKKKKNLLPVTYTAQWLHSDGVINVQLPCSHCAV